MRAINADRLKQDILDWEDCPNGFSDTYDKARIISEIDEAPTIDAEPVRHGKWTEHHEPYTWMGYTYWSCSECGFECGYEKDITIRTNYCPNCGAKMMR